MSIADKGVSVGEAAGKLGIGERAVLYKIQQGALKAKKIGRSWRVFNLEASSSEFELDQNGGNTRKTISNSKKKEQRTKGKIYDFRRLAPYNKLQNWLRRPELRGKQEVLEKMRETMGLLAMGFYQWDKKEKLRFYQRAREQLALVLHEVELCNFSSQPLTAGEWRDEIRDKNKVNKTDKAGVGIKEELFNDLHLEVMGSLIALSKSVEKGAKP